MPASRQQRKVPQPETNFSMALMEQLLLPLRAYAFQLDADYRVSYLSDHVARVTDYTADQLLGVQVIDPKWGAAGVEVGMQEYHRTLIERKPVLGQSYERLFVNGRRGVIMDSMLPHFDESGEFQGYSGLSMILSEVFNHADSNGSLVSVLKSRADQLEATLLQRNEELERSNAALTEILDAMGEGLLVTTSEEIYDDDNLIQFVNPAFLRQMNLDPKKVHPGAPFKRVNEALFERGEVKQRNTKTLHESLSQDGGLTISLNTLGRVIRVKGTERPQGGFVLVHTDVTELEQRNQMLEAARKAADVANAAKSNFLAAMSHEIRTPMNGIVGMTDLLSSTDLTAEQQEFVATIRSSALALTELISDILDFSKVEAGHFDLSPSVFGIGDMCKEVAALMRPMAEAKGLSFELDIADGVPEVVYGDTSRLRQILVNLLGNAIKFTVSGKVRLAVSGRSNIMFQVEDTGIGIPTDKLQSIFKPFEQAQGGLQRQFEGTGLGLAISLKLARAMGGGIKVHSVEGEGTLFSVQVPLAPARKTTQVHSRQTRSGEIDGAFVLVAEDNRTNQIVAERMLARLGAKCEIVPDGRAAVEKFAKGGFDLVLMDLSMPKLSGLDATRLIRQHEAEEARSRTPIIALTGNAFAQDRQDALEAGMDGFLSKPLQLKTLQDEIARHLSGAQAKSA
ncbi:ATP-binding protein [Primorskyibacter sp. S187A]|uniref:hybrid sensor histidine kinase/response regulator n=1 Tax=Primorskyibacter sp. S187A TaxID=3415130 RepID=UPI003C7BE79D